MKQNRWHSVQHKTENGRTGKKLKQFQYFHLPKSKKLEKSWEPYNVCNFQNTFFKANEHTEKPVKRTDKTWNEDKKTNSNI